MECHYATLGVSRDATADEIRRAYKRLALLYHPDKNGGDDAMFKKISHAYQILGDAAARREYDARAGSGSGSMAEMLAKLVQAVIRAVAAAKRAATAEPEAAPAPPQVTRVPIRVSLEDVYRARIKKIVVRVRPSLDSSEFASRTLYVSLLSYKPCYVFPNQGDGGGDLALDLEIEPHETIKVDALVCPYDLYVERPVSLYEFYYGARVRFEHVDGRSIECKKTFSDGSMTSVFRGLGLPYRREDTEEIARGDLYVFYRMREPSHGELDLGDPELKRVLKKHFS